MITLGGGGGDENAFLHRVLLGPLCAPEVRRVARQGMQETRKRAEEKCEGFMGRCERNNGKKGDAAVWSNAKLEVVVGA